MRIIFLPLVSAAICASLLSVSAYAKPDKVDGMNVPSGRIPQEIKNNRYPRTYYPNTEKLGRNDTPLFDLALKLEELEGPLKARTIAPGQSLEARLREHRLFL